MKLNTTTAAVTLLASTLALSGCGDRAEQAAPTAAAQAQSIDYSNYLDAAEREALTRAKTPTVGYGTYVPKAERSRAQESSTSDRQQLVDGGAGSPQTSDHGTHDWVRTAE